MTSPQTPDPVRLAWETVQVVRELLRTSPAGRLIEAGLPSCIDTIAEAARLAGKHTPTDTP